MKLSFFSLLLALLAPVAARITPGAVSEPEPDALALFQEKVRALEGQPGRELFLDDVCGDILTGIVGGALSIVKADLACTCTFDVLKLSLGASCASQEPVCFVPPDVVCGTPELGFSISLLSIFAGQFPFAGRICYNNLIIGGVLDLSAVPFCLDIDPNLLNKLIPESVNATISEGLDTSCDATIGDEPCTSCEVCDNGTVSFNCTNINSDVTGTCVDVGVIPTSFADIVRTDEVTLSLDGLE